MCVCVCVTVCAQARVHAITFLETYCIHKYIHSSADFFLYIEQYVISISFSSLPVVPHNGGSCSNFEDAIRGTRTDFESLLSNYLLLKFNIEKLLKYVTLQCKNVRIMTINCQKDINKSYERVCNSTRILIISFDRFRINGKTFAIGSTTKIRNLFDDFRKRKKSYFKRTPQVLDWPSEFRILTHSEFRILLSRICDTWVHNFETNGQTQSHLICILILVI